MVDLRPDHLAVVLAILKAELPHCEVWAFGSRAKWTARDTSDLDLAIRCDQPLSLHTMARLRSSFEESYLPFTVDLVDWNRVAEDFRGVIAAQKVLLQSVPTRSARTQDLPWRAVPLSECADFLAGSTPARSRKDYWGGGIPWMAANDMKQLRLSESAEHISSRALVEGARLVPAGTVMIVVRGAILHQDLPIGILMRPMSFSQDLLALRPRPNVLPEFLAYALLGNKAALLSLVDSVSQGLGRLHAGALASFPVAIPPLSEQRAIAHVLGTLEDKIELCGGMSQTLQAMARELGSQAKPLFEMPLVEMMAAQALEAGTVAALRETLLPRLVSGEIRVREARKIAEAA